MGILTRATFILYHITISAMAKKLLQDKEIPGIEIYIIAYLV